MRRWFEFGLGGPLLQGPWSSDSDRWGGLYPAAFISMPHKARLFEFLNASASSANLFSAIWVRQHDQGVDPAPDCTAEHIPRNLSAEIVKSGGLYANPNLLPWTGFPIFDENGNPTGNYSGALIEFSQEPPDKDGA